MKPSRGVAEERESVCLRRADVGKEGSDILRRAFPDAPAISRPEVPVAGGPQPMIIEVSSDQENFSTEHPSAKAQARLQSSHEDARRTRDSSQPAGQRPRPAVGIGRDGCARGVL
jgi:hypothetical protein